MALFLLVLIIYTLPVSANEQKALDNPRGIEKQVTDYILCRQCGADISSSDFLVSKLSPVAIDSFNDTLFNKGNVLIQVLSHDFFFHFPIITIEYSICESTGEWEDSPWFPNYKWKPCTCPECGAFIGWIFDSTDLNTMTPDRFYGLILQNLVSEHCKYRFLFYFERFLLLPSMFLMLNSFCKGILGKVILLTFFL